MACLDVEALAEYVNSYIFPGVSLKRTREIKDKLFKVDNIAYPLEHYHDKRRNAIIRNIDSILLRLKFIKDEGLIDNEIEIARCISHDLFIIGLHLGLFVSAFKLQSSEAQREE